MSLGQSACAIEHEQQVQVQEARARGRGEQLVSAVSSVFEYPSFAPDWFISQAPGQQIVVPGVGVMQLKDLENL